MQATEPLRLKGACTVPTVRTHHDAVLRALAQGGSISLDLSEVTDADVTLVQLVLAARNTATRQGSSLAITAASDAVLTTFQRAGAPLSTQPPSSSSEA